jgi:pimeloyl-ACP methyl ester carboxylesterase
MQQHIFEVQLAASEDVATVEARTDLADITAPCLLVSGRYDFADFREIAVQLSGQLANARHLELAWAGHLPNLERPDAVNAMLIDFLRENGIVAGSAER